MSEAAVVVRRPGGARPRTGTYLRRVLAYRGFVAELSRAEVEAGHADTVLGRVWSVLNPLLLAGVYLLLLTVLRRGRAGPDDVGFAGLVGALFAYTWTANTLNGAKTSILRGARLVLSTEFPRMVLPLTAVLTAARLFLPAVAVYAVIHAAAGRPLTGWLVVVPLSLLVQGVIGVGLALLVAAANVVVRDVESFLRYVLRLGVYASPVLYTVAAASEAGARWVLLANPLGGALGAQQQALAGLPPSADLVLAAAAWAALLIVVGTVVFLRVEHRLAPRL